MKKLAFLIAILLLSFALTSGEETSYTNYSFARLSYVTGEAYVQRSTELGYEEAVINTPISEGDRMGTTDGRAEVYLGKRNYLRLDKNTKVDFLNLPKRGYDLTRIRIWAGNIYFNVNFLEKEKNIEIHTSDVSIYVLDSGLYRIDVREGRETEIFVFEGLVEASSEDGSVLIKNGQRLEVANGRFTSSPTQFYAQAEDSFDRWSEYRDSQIKKRVAKRYLPDELEDFEYELSNYGSWVYLRPYGNVWVPRGLDSGWRPYYNGRWLWLPLSGWTWLPYEPWGWSTFHYGRWHWSIGLGWYWIPTSIWGPGWVSWYWGYDYFGWAPLSYYGYPGVIINDLYYGRYWGEYYPYNSRALTVIHKNQLQAKNVSKVALKQDSVKTLGKITLSNKSIPVKPAAGKVSIEKIGEKKLILRKDYRPLSTSYPIRSQAGKTYSRELKKTDGIEKESSALLKSKEIESRSSRGYIKGGSYGYPPSDKISIKNVSKDYRSSRSNSFLSRVYKYISGSSASSYIKGGSSYSSSKSISSRSSGSRSSSSVNRRGSSSSGRSSSSGSRSRSSGSGKVKKE